MKRTTWKKLAIILSLSLALTGLAACSPKKESTSEKTGEGGGSTGKVKVGYVINNLNDTFQTYILEAAKEYAKENDIELMVENAEEDTIKQQDKVMSLLQKDVQGIVVIPTDTSAMEPITEAVQEAGIPLAYVNRNPYAGKEKEIPDNVFYIGSDEKTGGEMQMEYIGEQLGGKGGVAVLMGILGNEGAVKRTEGVEEVAKAKFKDVKILAKEAATWQRDEGMTVTENFITTYGDKLNAIISNNDEMALGAVEALKANGLTGKVKVAGLDAIPDALEALEKGELTCTIFQDAKGQGGTAVKTVFEAINGKPSSEKVIYIPFQLVTPENVAEFK